MVWGQLIGVDRRDPAEPFEEACERCGGTGSTQNQHDHWRGCPPCEGSGCVLTEQGDALKALVKRWVSEAIKEKFTP
jgi:DnaJ-class molecular chaperone